MHHPVIWDIKGKCAFGGSIINRDQSHLLKVVTTHCKDKVKQTNQIKLDMKHSKGIPEKHMSLFVWAPCLTILLR